MALPQGFVDLALAYGSVNGAFVNVIGTVVDIMPATTTRTGDIMLTFKLLDRSLSKSVTGSDGLRVRFFMKEAHSLPQIRSIGDVVLLRKIKVFDRDGQPVLLSNYQTGVLVFPASGIPDLNFSIAFLDKQRLECSGAEQMKTSITIGEQQYVMALKQEMNAMVGQHLERGLRIDEQRAARQIDVISEPAAKRLKVNNSFGQKFRLVEELHPGTWADICGKVVKNISAGYGGNDVYITDYTSNDLLRYYSPPEEADHFRDGDAFGYSGTSKKPWPGPYKHMVLKVNVKPPHAAYADRVLREGSWVLLKNVKVRIADNNKLEGDMWPSKVDPERVKMQELVNVELPEIQAILRREEKYWSVRNPKIDKTTSGPAKLSKGEKKRRKKLAKQEQQRHAGQGEKAEETHSNPTKKDRNPYVRCSHEDVALTAVKDILDPENQKHITLLPNGCSLNLPFINVRYRSRVRVVDFEPKMLEDFAIQPVSEGDDSIDSMAWQYDTPKYEWFFSLLLEDASQPSSDQPTARIRVQVHHQEAQFLLGNAVADPENLRHNPQLLAKLREKLFVLWGNLEENNGVDLNNLPFECCIQEYGIEVDSENHTDNPTITNGWQRMYSMFGTTLL